MPEQSTITSIPLSKRKNRLWLAIVLAFCIGAIYLLLIAVGQNHFPVWVLLITGCLGLFFFLLSVLLFFKLRDAQPGLMLSREGIHDNSSGIAISLLRWKDIAKLEPLDISGTKLVLIFVKNPGYYLAQAGPWKKFWLRQNQLMYGTPFCISANVLKCSFEELLSVLNQELIQWQEGINDD